MGNSFYYPFEKNGFDYSQESIASLSEYEKYEFSFHPEWQKSLDYLSNLLGMQLSIKSQSWSRNISRIKPM